MDGWAAARAKAGPTSTAHQDTVDMVRRSVILLVMAGLAACDFPTEPPLWDTTWQVPVESIVVSAADLLPASVDVNADSTEFISETPEASIQVSLAELCTLCVLVDGIRTPKPEFADTQTTSTSLPAELVSATLAGGSFDVVMDHSFNFDPLRPNSDPDAPTGYVVFRVTSSGAVVAYDSISGDDTAFPSGITLAPDLAVQPVQVSGSIDLEVVIYSPEGDSVTVESSDTAGVTLNPSTVRISQVTIDAASITIDPVDTTMDFSGVDSTAIDHVQSGALLVAVANPWDVTGTMDVTFQPPTPSIRRSFTLDPGSYQERIDFSGSEIRSMLRAGEVGVRATGSVSSTGTLTLAPADRLQVDGNLELVVLIGDTEGL